jgi:hypothetical protein
MVRGLSRRTRSGRTGLVETGTRPGVVAQIAHTGALPDRPVSQPDPEKLDPAVRARPRVVPIVAAMRAPPSHFFSNRIGWDTKLGCLCGG